MPDCASIDPLVTQYVDEGLPVDLKVMVETHIGRCQTCRARVAAERSVHDLLGARRGQLCGDAAPKDLQRRCGALAAFRPREDGGIERFGLVPRLIAASVALAAAGAAVFAATSHSPRLMAAELAADHVKCLALNAVLRAHHSMVDVHRALASSVGDMAELPGEPGRDALEIIGERPCLYGEGQVAHVMYRHEGHPVSLFILPRKRVEAERLSILGHAADMWSVGDRTFVLVMRGDVQEVERTASIVHAALR